jgi:hypothetical protein
VLDVLAGSCKSSLEYDGMPDWVIGVIVYNPGKKVTKSLYQYYD